MFGKYRWSVAILAAAALLLESTLIRLLAIAQFYHFAFLVVSLALLGYGASGSLLSVSARLRSTPLDKLLFSIGIGFTISVGVAYCVVTFLPFDSYSIAWDRRQILYFLLYYLALTLPFLMSGLGIGAAIAQFKEKSHLVYAANLIGSGVGALLAPIFLWLAGVPGSVLLSAMMGLIATLPLTNSDEFGERGKNVQKQSVQLVLKILMGCGAAFFGVLTALNIDARAPLGMTISPYKGLAQVRRYPDAEILSRRWNAISRIDVVANAGVHQYPGLSYLYAEELPSQLGLSIDADVLLPVTFSQPEEFEAAAFLPESVVFDLRPAGDVLVLDSGGGLGVLQALAGGASSITTVEENRLVYQAISESASDFNVFDHEQVKTVWETPRIFLAGDDARYDIVFIPLTDAFRPIASGAYSLGEDYSLTVDSFSSILDRLWPSGVLVITRWLQTPPSEDLRLATTLVEAIEQAGFDPRESLTFYRGIQTMTVLVNPLGWSDADRQDVRTFTESRKYDLVWTANIQEDEVNRFNRLPEPVYYTAIRNLLTTADRNLFYRTSDFNLKPPTDDHPFFFHFFTWEQTPEVLAMVGHTWQPFGGSGYFVMLALLALALVLSILLIVVPLFCKPKDRGNRHQGGLRWKALTYFTFLGFGFLLIEIPLIQQWILLFGHPIYAFTVVVVTFLLFSGFGSALARKDWLPIRMIFILIVLLAFLVPLILPRMTDAILGWPLIFRGLAAVFSLTPLAILMGMPFSLGLVVLERSSPDLIPWAWAVNGCASVIASVCAAILTLSYGFTVVLLAGGVMYAGASAIYLFSFKSRGLPIPEVL